MKNLIYVVGHKCFPKLIHPAFCTIQVGNEMDLGMSRDNSGIDEISAKNQRFCELTALYWIWKNDKESDFMGVNHYRRFFSTMDYSRHWVVSRRIRDEEKIEQYCDLNELIARLSQSSIVVPRPVYLVDNLEEAYEQAHCAEDWALMKDVILRLYPEYGEVLPKACKTKLFYPGNLFVMSRQQLNIYCEWLFSILFELEGLIPEKTDLYQNRVFGFLAERLFNIFLEKNFAPSQRIEYPVLYWNPEGGWRFNIQLKTPAHYLYKLLR